MLEGCELRKILKNRKAMSPVIAAIILVAVTVAVSIAVAAWMGSLTIGFMETEQLTVTRVEFDVTGEGETAVNNIVTVYVQNTGTTDIVITQAVVTGYNVTETLPILIADGTMIKGTSDGIALTLTAPNEWVSGSAYNIQLLTSKGNTFSYRATA